MVDLTIKFVVQRAGEARPAEGTLETASAIGPFRGNTAFRIAI